MSKNIQVEGKVRIKRIRKGGPLDTDRWPAIPTELKAGDVEGFNWTDEGWYGVKVNPQGIEVLLPTAVKYSDFDSCKAACDVHNQFIGMKPEQIAVLYAQRRF